MNQDLTQHERMVDQWGRPLAWQGKWVLHNPYGGVPWDAFTPVLPAEYPEKYYHTERG